MHSKIIGTGSYLPRNRVSNRELESRVATSDEWIKSRTGIEARHIAGDGESTSEMACLAARQAMDSAGVSNDDIDLIIVATTTPDAVFPSMACTVQAKLGIKQGAAFDVQAVCVLTEVATEALEKNNFQPEQLDWLIPHQANMRIINATATRIGVPSDKVVSTVSQHGNTSAASVPLELDVAVRDGRVKPGDLIFLQGVGGGMTWGSIILKWH